MGYVEYFAAAEALEKPRQFFLQSSILETLAFGGDPLSAPFVGVVHVRAVSEQEHVGPIGLGEWRDGS